MGSGRGDSFPFDIEPNGIPFGSKSKEKLSPRSYPIQFERKWKNSFLSQNRGPARQYQNAIQHAHMFWSSDCNLTFLRLNFERGNFFISTFPKPWQTVFPVVISSYLIYYFLFYFFLFHIHMYRYTYKIINE